MSFTATTASTFWSAHLAAIEQRGISVAQYAREHDLSVQSLYGWRSRQRQDAVTAKPPVRFAEIVASPPARTSVSVTASTSGADRIP